MDDYGCSEICCHAACLGYFAHYFPSFSDDSCTDCVRENKLYFGSDGWPANASNQ